MPPFGSDQWIRRYYGWNNFMSGNIEGGTVVKALPSHQCGLGSSPLIDATSGLSSLLVLFSGWKSSTVNPLLSPPEGLLISNTFEGDLIETGGLHVFNLANTMVSVLHKERENTKWKTLVTRSYAAEDKKQFNLPAGKKTIPDQSTQSLTVVID